MLSLRNLELLIVMKGRFKGAAPAVAGGPMFTLAPCMAMSAGEVICAGFSPSSLAIENGGRHPVASTVLFNSAVLGCHEAQVSQAASWRSARGGEPPALELDGRDASQIHKHPIRATPTQPSTPSPDPRGVQPLVAHRHLPLLILPLYTSHIHT
jgi:hypothetical protein